MCLEEAEAAIDRLIKELQELKKNWQAWRESPLGSAGEESKN